MRSHGFMLVGALVALSLPALAQTPATPTTPAPAPKVAPASPAGDPVVATVNGQPIHASDVHAAMSGLPAQYRQLPPKMLFPMLLDQLIDRKALLLYAEKQGLQNDPEVKAAMTRAADGALQNALLRRDIAPQVTEAKVRARFEATVAHKPGAEEVHARHILVPTEAEATRIIAQLKGGADFAKLAKQYSKDPGAADGGDLGWFKKGDMLPAFSAVAFTLQPGQISQTPVHTQYGWHVIQVEGRRQAPPPTFEEASAHIRQEMIQNAIRSEVTAAKQGVVIKQFNLDGSAPQATDSAEPPPAK